MNWVTDIWKKLTKTDDEEEDDFVDDIPQTQVEKGETIKKYGSAAGTGKILDVNTTTKLQVVVMKPVNFNTVEEIVDHLKDRHTVVLNLETTDVEIARKIVTFVSGAAYAIRGKVQTVAVRTYIVIPFDVSLSGNIMDEIESSGLYFE